MKAIETVYRGYRFRSRLEARWAVFFDAMGYKWEYEPEGYDLGGGVLYLPDFRIVSPQGLVSWYDVKPSGVIKDVKVSAFIDALEKSGSNDSVTILSGDPALFFDANEYGGVCPRCGAITRVFDSLLEYDDEFAVGCHPCDMDTPCGGGHPVERGMFMDCYPHKGMVTVDRGDWRQFVYIKLREACEKARAARFEHNERERMARI